MVEPALPVLTPSMLTWLRAFDAAARASSFTRAADELRLTQSAMSQQIRQLEAALGVALFHRDPGRLRLTADGEMLRLGTAEAFSALREAVVRVGRPGGAVPVKVSCSPGFAVRWLGPRLGRFAARHPDWDVRLHAEYHAIDRGRIGIDKVAVAIRYDPDRSDDANACVFLDELLVPVAAPGFASVGGRAAFDPAHLLHDAEPWAGAPAGAEWREWLAATDMPIPDLIGGRKFNLTQLAIGAAVDGGGIAIGRLAIVLDDLRAGRLVAAAPVVVRSTAHYHLRVAERTARTAAFTRWLEEEAAAFVSQRNEWLRASGMRLVSDQTDLTPAR